MANQGLQSSLGWPTMAGNASLDRAQLHVQASETRAGHHCMYAADADWVQKICSSVQGMLYVVS